MIHYRGIYHERTEDAPFIGALVCAKDCNINCNGCFNQHLKDSPLLMDTSNRIVQSIKANHFNQGIILAGLEWSLQIEEAIDIAIESHKYGMKVMLYTGKDSFPKESKIHFDYIKFGRYDDTKNTSHKEYGVTLASENQHIEKRGIDY